MLKEGPIPPNELNVIPPQDSLIIHRLFDSPPSTLQIELIPSGETNKNYKVSYDGSLYVARLPYLDDRIVDKKKRKIEVENIRGLIGNKKSSRVIAHYEMYIYDGQDQLGSTSRKMDGLPDGTAVTRYIEGTDITTTLLRESEVQRSLVRTLHAFHSSGVRFVNRYDPFEDEIAKYKRIVYSSKDLPMLADVHTVSRIDELTKQLEVWFPPDEPISTHNDLIFGNLRMGEDAAIINMIVTFWWGSAKYVQASGEKEKQDFAKYVADRRDKLEALTLL